MARPPVRGDFTQRSPIREAAVAEAMAALRSGRLPRDNAAPGETSVAALPERVHAAWRGARYRLAVASGGQAMQVALRAVGVKPGDRVLTIAGAGAEPVLVEITEDLVIDLDDLAARARASGARTLLLSTMRGRLCDMARLAACAERLALIEGCAQTMGERRSGRRSGGFGLAGCFSTRTCKHINSGEGGVLTCDDAAFMARAARLSGRCTRHYRHGAGPGPQVRADIRLDTPDMSARTDTPRAAILRPQLGALDEAVAAWNARRDRLAAALSRHRLVRLPQRPPQARRVGASLQFRVPGIGADAARRFPAATLAGGVALEWFGAPEPAMAEACAA